MYFIRWGYSNCTSEIFGHIPWYWSMCRVIRDVFASKSQGMHSSVSWKTTMMSPSNEQCLLREVYLIYLTTTVGNNHYEIRKVCF